MLLLRYIYKSESIFCYFKETIMTNTDKESEQAKRALDEAKKGVLKKIITKKMPAEKKDVVD